MEQLVTTTYLEMLSESQAVPFTRERSLELLKAEISCPELNRFFYVAVGSEWWWYSRLAWKYEQWRAYLDRPEIETWIAYKCGTPVGFFELEMQPEERVEIVYFGLLPSFVGRGLGSELLNCALERAWQLGPSRVWLHTCTLDHPRALPNYLAKGFVVYDRKEKVENLPDEALEAWPQGTS